MDSQLEQQVNSVVNSLEWQFLGTILGFSQDQLASASSALVDASVKADPGAKSVSVQFSAVKIYNYTIAKNGTIGISFGNNLSPSLFIEGTTVTIPSPISDDQYPVDVRVVFSSGDKGSISALISGTINQTVLNVPVIDLKLSDPLIVVGVNSATPEIPTVGFGGDITLGSSLDLSGVVLFVSKDPKSSVLVASVSTLSLETIAECFPGVNSVPDVMKPVLSGVSISGPSGEGFPIDVSGAAYAGLADDLDAKQLDRVSDAFNKAGVALPTDPNQVVLVVLSAGEKWSITNLQDETHRHYQLATSADGKTIQVTVDAQVYVAMTGATVAGNSFQKGMAVRGHVDIFGIGGNVDLEIDTDFSLNESYSVDAGSVPIPAVSIPGFPSIPGFSIPIGTVSVGVSISIGSANLNFSAAGIGFNIPLTAGATLQEQVIDAIKKYFTPDPAGYAADVANFFESLGEDIKHIFTSGIPIGGGSDWKPPDPNNTTSQQIADSMASSLKNPGSEPWNFCSPIARGSLPTVVTIAYDGVTALQFVTQWAGWKFVPSQLVGPLKQNGYAAGDIGGAIMTVYQMPAVVAAQLLNDAGFALSDVGSGLVSSCGVASWPLLAKILVGAGYDFKAVAGFLSSQRFNMSLSAAETASFLAEAGYTVSTQWPDPAVSYFIVPAGGRAEITCRLLYDNGDGNLRFNDQDDGTGRALWQFASVSDGVYTITSARDYLSCAYDSTAANLYGKDDESGRQQWTLTPTGDGSFTITIEKSGALQNASYKYLSCRPTGDGVDMYCQDDGSGRQQWRLVPSSALKSMDYAIQVGGWSADVGTFLGDNGQGGVAMSANSYPWTFERVAQRVYNIRPNPAKSYLDSNQNSSSPPQNLTFADLYSEDDGSGRQRWTLTLTVDGSFTVTIEQQGALNSSAYKYLWCSTVGPINLWNQDDGSGRQRWSVSWAQPLSLSLNATGWPQLAQSLVGAGYSVDAVADCFRNCRFNLSLNASEATFVLKEAGYERSWQPACDRTQYVIQVKGGMNANVGTCFLGPDQSWMSVVMWNTNLKGAPGDAANWEFQQVTPGTAGVYYLTARWTGWNLNGYQVDGNTPANPQVGLAQSADTSLQQWTLTAIGDGSYTLTLGKPGDPNCQYLSTRPDASVLDLCNTDDGSGRQRWLISMSPNPVPGPG